MPSASADHQQPLHGRRAVDGDGLVTRRTRPRRHPDVATVTATLALCVPLLMFAIEARVRRRERAAADPPAAPPRPLAEQAAR